MTNRNTPTDRVRGLEALELAGALGLYVWLDLGFDRGSQAMTARQAWSTIRESDGRITARDFYTFEPANEVQP